MSGAEGPPASASLVSDEGAPLVGGRFARQLLARLAARRIGARSAELALWLFLTLLPAMLLGGLFVSRIIPIDTAAGAALLDALPRATRELLGGELHRVARWPAALVACLGLASLVGLASNAVLAVFRSADELVGSKSPRGRWAAARVTFAIAVASVGVLLLVGGVTWIAILAGFEPARVEAFETSNVGSGVRVVLGGALWFGAVFGLFRAALPRHTRRFMPVAPGALLTLGIQVGMAAGATFYLRLVAEWGALATLVGSLAITVSALYACAAAVFIGMEFNALLGERVRLRLRARRKLAGMRRRHARAFAAAAA